MIKYRSGSMPELYISTTIKRKAQQSMESAHTLTQRETLMKNVFIYKLEKENRDLRIKLKELNEKLNSIIGLRKPKTIKKKEKKPVSNSDQLKNYEKEMNYYK